MDEEELTAIISNLDNCGPVIGRRVASELLRQDFGRHTGFSRLDEVPYRMAKWCHARIQGLKADGRI